MIYETDKYTYNFQQFKMIRSFGDSILNGKITLDEVDKKSNLLENILEFSNRARLRAQVGKKKNRELILNAFKSEIYSLKLI